MSIDPMFQPPSGDPMMADSGTSGFGQLTAGISVVMPSHLGRERLHHALSTLFHQTLPPDLFEVVVVLNGPPDGSLDLIHEFREQAPGMELRTISIPTAGASRAYNAGIAAARRHYTTFVDDDDYVSPRFLEGLLAAAGPRTVSIANIVDVTPDGQQNPDNYINREVQRLAGQTLAASQIRVATSSNAPKAVATHLIKAISFPLECESGQDVVFWTTLVARHQVDFRLCNASDEAIYFRLLRPESVSRRSMSFDFNVRQRLDVISHLDALIASAPSAVHDLIHDRMRAQTGFIHRFLKQNPEQHREVVKLLDGYPIAHMPYRTMNGTQARGLAIAYAFPPYADTSAVVVAKRIREYSEVVDVVYNTMDRIRDIDQSLMRIVGPFVGRSAGVASPTYFASWESMEQFAMAGMKTIESWEEASGRYQWVYSRAQFAASHFLAAAYKLANTSVTWRAEFSDPLSRDVQDRDRGAPIGDGALYQLLVEGLTRLGLPIPQTDNCFTWCEEVTYALADELIFTNSNQLEYMLGYCSDSSLAEIARRKATIAAQPTLGRKFYSLVNSTYPLQACRINIAYFGNLYVTRGLDDVLVAMAKLNDSVRDLIQLTVFTSKPHEIDQRIERLGISASVHARPYVRYLEFLNLTTRFDCLIVNDATTADGHGINPFLPSKWSDYRGSGTLVWGLVEPGSPLSKEALDIVSPVGDIDAACSVLERLPLQVANTQPTHQGTRKPDTLRIGLTESHD